MAAKRPPARTTASSTARTSAEPLSSAEPVSSANGMPAWIHDAVGQGVKPDQALALIGMGLVQRLAAGEDGSTWLWSEAEDGGKADLGGLRRRLELTALALQTGAPLSTAEVTALMGARPGAAKVERGGLMARRLSRNVWKLERSTGTSSSGSGGSSGGAGSSGASSDEGERSAFGGGFSNGFARRF